jgi:glycerol-3-phosphate dehydrogenase
MAFTLEDVVMRRTSIGQLGAPPQAAVEKTATTMAAQLGWNDELKTGEIECLAANFRLAPA